MPMNRKLYPDNWKEIAAERKAAAGYECEECGAPAGAWVRHYLSDRAKWEVTFVDSSGNDLKIWWNNEDQLLDKPVLVQLGVAHLDQNPANNDPTNLKVLCRGCHLRYDAPFHAVKARKTKLKKKHQSILMAGQLLMPLEVE